MTNVRRDDRGHADEGAALVIVLAIVAVTGLVATALLGQAGAHLNATTALRDQRDRIFAADAGLEQGLASLPACGAPSLAVPRGRDNSVIEVAVSCTPSSGSGGARYYDIVSVATDAERHVSAATARIVEVTPDPLLPPLFVPVAWRTASG